MKFQPVADNPFQTQISFHVLIEQLEAIAAQPGVEAAYALALLKEIEHFSELRNGITDTNQLPKNTNLIHRLLSGLFPAALTNNEIKAITIPFHDIIINPTERFKTILNDAGPEFDLIIRNFDDHQFYVLCCCIILNTIYKTKLDFNKPLFYDIPTQAGIVKHYRLLYNADFTEIIPTEKAKPITQAEIELLINNYDNLELWKEKFPKESYLLKGFTILNLVDVTVDNAVSSLKSALLKSAQEVTLNNNLPDIFRSIFNLNSLKVGFTAYDHEQKKLTHTPFTQPINSFLLNHRTDDHIEPILCSESYSTIIEKKRFFAVSDAKQYFDQHPDNPLIRHFLNQNIQSFILAAVVKDNQLLGIIELVSPNIGDLNSVNANKLDVVMPFLVDTIDRSVNEYRNQIQAVIQNEYTTLHPSVHWKFKKEAENFIRCNSLKKDYIPREIVFKDVYALYGQIDIKGSSDSRNSSIQKDLNYQLETLIQIIERVQINDEDLNSILSKLRLFKAITANDSLNLQLDSEQEIQYFIDTKVHSLLKKYEKTDPIAEVEITGYFQRLNKKDNDFFVYRQKYDTTVSTINQKIATVLDQSQEKAQQIFPHYYERFKSDGVDHNLYVGSAITPTEPFNLECLHKLREWQIIALCEMEREHHKIKLTLPYQLEVTALILVFSSPISIRFRMDEKRFDVDGTYNARFEIIKKRIDKALIKDTEERITKAGYLTIVYSNKMEETEYQKYIQQLQAKHYLHQNIEVLEVQDLQSITGLKALRVEILNEEV